MITKSLAGVAAGVLLVGGGALATAQANHTPGHPDPTPAAPAPSPTPSEQNFAVSSGDYPASVATTTALRVRRTVQFAANNPGGVRVSATAADTEPHGRATVVVAGKSRSARVRNGRAVVPLPRRLQPGTYTARALYAPAAGSNFEKSSGRDTYRVVKSRSEVSIQARRISRGHRPVIRTAVETTTRVTPRGQIRIIVAKGNTRHAKTVRLLNGQAVVRFPKAHRRGLWDVKAVYLGNHVVRRDVGTSTFRVTR